jgi:hypothetical protein
MRISIFYSGLGFKKGWIVTPEAIWMKINVSGGNCPELSFLGAFGMW